MIKLFTKFNHLLKKLTELKDDTKQIKDFRISLRVNNDIDIIILAESELNSLGIKEEINVDITLVNSSDLEDDPYLSEIFEKKEQNYNISRSRRRFTNLLDFQTENSYIPPCPVVTFYSYKGGMGRSTSISACASHLSVHEKKKIIIIDCDFEAPGFTNFFLDDPGTVKNHLGFVEYMFDKESDESIEVNKYMWEVPKKYSGQSEIYIMPAGNLSDEIISDINEHQIFKTHKEHYLEGLARLDFASTEYIVNRFSNLIQDIYDSVKPDMIFIDSRTGFTDIFGLTAVKLSTFMVGFFGNTMQNLPGLHFYIDIINKIKKRFSGILVNSFSNNDDFEYFKNIVDDYIQQIPDKNDLGIDIQTFFFPRNNVLARLGMPNERIEDFVELIEDKTLGRHYLALFNKINDFSNNLLKKENKLLENLNKNLKTISNNKDEEIVDIEQNLSITENIKELEPKELRKKILNNLLENWPELYAEDIDFQKEHDENKYFYRPCMQDIFNLDKFLILGNKGTGKSYIYQSLKNDDIVKELKKRANKTYNYIFYPLVDKSTKFLFITNELDIYKSEHSNIFFNNFWLVYTWNAIMQIANKNNLAYQTNLNSFEVEKSHETAEKLYNIITNTKKLIEIEKDLKKLDKFLLTENKYLIVIYDNLDEMVMPHKWQNQIAPLLNFWKYSSYNRIFSKLFVRTDLFDKISGITNIQNLRNNAIEIEWTKEEVFAYFFKLVFSKSKEEFFKLMNLYNDFDEETIKHIRTKSKTINQLPLDENYLRKLSQTFFGQYTADPRHGESYDWLYKNLMNADETISIRPFIDLLEASIKKWELNLRNYEIKKNEKEYQWIMKEKPILPYQTYTDKDVRKKAVERHFNDLASEEGNQDLKKIFDFIDRNKEYQYYIYNQYHLEDLFNKVKNKYPNNLENNSNDELRKLLIVNGIIREMPVRGGGKKYTFAFLYKYRLGLRNRRP